MAANDRALVSATFMAGVAAADPGSAVTCVISKLEKPAQIIAIGKAAGRMAQAALSHFPGTKCLVVTNYENAKPLAGATVLAAGHPVPDENGAQAARAVIAALNALSGPVLALISGGGSALLPAPSGKITLDDKATVNSILLGAGLDIQGMNLVRQQLSDLKGGGFLRHAAPHKVTALILSDVVGDDLSTIASGPTVAPMGTAADAAALLKNRGLWGQMPQSVRDHLIDVIPPTVLPDARNILVGSNAQSVAAMAAALQEPYRILRPVEGDVTHAAKAICDQSEPGITLWGGETTVVLKGQGRGGRNQELALRIALEAQARGWSAWTCLQGGTDGRDGPTDAAGGLVDQGTLDRIADNGGNIAVLLANNDSYAALTLAGDLLMTDATGTNVADLGILVRR